MADPSGLARTAYYNNLLLVRALIPIKPPDQRSRAKHWADVLGTETKTGEELATKNEYLWYLLLEIQYGEMKSPPFDKHPPTGRLMPLSSVVDAETYQKVLNGVKNEIYFKDTFEQISLDKMKKSTGRFDDPNSYAYGTPWATQKTTAQKPTKTSQKTARGYQDDGEEELKSSANKPQGDYTPIEFLSNQPRPHQGAICYGAVFSDFVKDDTGDKNRRD